MTKENKIIKDLKERNGKLVNQYRDRDIRCVSLERQLEKLQQENLDLRIQVSAREEVANKYKEVIDKLKDKLMNYFDINKDCYFYVLTRDKSAFQYGTMTFDDFKEFDEEQINDIVDFLLKEVE